MASIENVGEIMDLVKSRELGTVRILSTVCKSDGVLDRLSSQTSSIEFPLHLIIMDLQTISNQVLFPQLWAWSEQRGIVRSEIYMPDIMANAAYGPNLTLLKGKSRI